MPRSSSNPAANAAIIRDAVDTVKALKAARQAQKPRGKRSKAARQLRDWTMEFFTEELPAEEFFNSEDELIARVASGKLLHGSTI